MSENQLKSSSLRQCPLCATEDTETVFSLSCGNLDRSSLYPQVRINVCPQCRHIFNELTGDDLHGLNSYYNDEYALANLGVTDKTADRPGSSGLFTTRRYDQLYNALSSHVTRTQKVLDVGCALGGFLDYLNLKGFTNLWGVDMSAKYVDQARSGNQHRIELGNAESLPFRNHTFDVVVMEQVLEHLADPLKAFQEARRVLKPEGLFCVGVPDASRYSDFYFFDFYWFLLREHIQHFDNAHLNILASYAGFRQIAHQQTAHAVMSERMMMPNLYALFRVKNPIDTTTAKMGEKSALKERITSYISSEKNKLLERQRMISDLSQSRRPVFVWGVGREFLYLYESGGLKDCAIVGLIDANPFKQKTCTVGGIRIGAGKEILREKTEDSVLLITAVAHTAAIKRAAGELGFKGRIVDFSASHRHAPNGYRKD